MLYNDIITQWDYFTTILLLNNLQQDYYSLLYNEIITQCFTTILLLNA